MGQLNFNIALAAIHTHIRAKATKAFQFAMLEATAVLT